MPTDILPRTTLAFNVTEKLVFTIFTRSKSFKIDPF